MKKILLTGFEPFNGETINPSWEVARLVGEQFDNVKAVLLPCAFEASLETLYIEIARNQPDIVICLGQAGGRATIDVERVAINLNDALIPDNQGKQPIDTPVVENAPNAYFTTLPSKAIVQRLRANGVPASLSLSAGSYVCNHIMFGLLHSLALHHPNCLGGFIHLPFLTEQGVGPRSVPTMSLETMVKGVKIALETALATNTDLSIAGGAIC